VEISKFLVLLDINEALKISKTLNSTQNIKLVMKIKNIKIKIVEKRNTKLINMLEMTLLLSNTEICSTRYILYLQLTLQINQTVKAKLLPFTLKMENKMMLKHIKQMIALHSMMI
jgi:hypothetical protein